MRVLEVKASDELHSFHGQIFTAGLSNLATRPRPHSNTIAPITHVNFKLLSHHRSLTLHALSSCNPDAMDVATA